MRHPFKLIACLLLAAIAWPSFATAQSTTTVTTYVVKTQEERKSTRWTLTEWLRIKERMRMMDLWLAMFSNPKQDKFKPELNLVYGVTQGSFAVAEGPLTESADVQGTQARAQLWLTNLVTASTGIRMINIDLGVEGMMRDSGFFTPTTAEAATATTTAVPPVTVNNRRMNTQTWAADLRLFGKSIQDSSLVLKYGRFQNDNELFAEDELTGGTRTVGQAVGAELSVYLLKWLGFEGNYWQYGNAGDDLTGSYYDYMGFIEVSLLRIFVGQYQEDWSFARQDRDVSVEDSGLIGGLKLQL